MKFSLHVSLRMILKCESLFLVFFLFLCRVNVWCVDEILRDLGNLLETSKKLARMSTAIYGYFYVLIFQGNSHCLSGVHAYSQCVVNCAVSSLFEISGFWNQDFNVPSSFFSTAIASDSSTSYADVWNSSAKPCGLLDSLVRMLQCTLEH